MENDYLNKAIDRINYSKTLELKREIVQNLVNKNLKMTIRSTYRAHS